MVQVDVSPEEINKYLSEQIMKSALGTKVRVVIEEAIKDIDKPKGYGEEGILTTAIKAVIRDEVVKLIDKEYREKVRKAVQEKMTEAVVDNMVQKAWEQIFKI